ncbi:conserved protein of unknown function [Burkholderia multivorans]
MLAVEVSDDDVLVDDALVDALAADGGGGVLPDCCATVWNRSPRNCWSALPTELDDVDDVLPVESTDDVDAFVSVDDVPVLLDDVSPSWASAAAMAAASGFVLESLLDVLDDESVLVWDSARFNALACQICALALVPVNAEIDMNGLRECGDMPDASATMAEAQAILRLRVSRSE